MYNTDMANSPFFSGRISQELYDCVQRHIEVTGEGKTDILKNALAQYINFDLDNIKTKGTTPKIIHDIEEIKEDIKLLTERIEKLELPKAKKIESKKENKEKLPLFPHEETTEGIYSYKDVMEKLNISDGKLKKIYERGTDIKQSGMIWSPMKEKGKRRFKAKKITDDNK